ncbi:MULTISPECIES: hypothetical protein [Rhodococcus]|uniref:hypothetical protein n=1 Tax=Rhodococcus TaxID=1827 RepID=UPI000C7C3122|nr:MULTISPECIES: hypothetical protein [Rhodococcus]AUM18269.1 hypothetical protein CSW53_18105 [Rhodococcus ruber]
MPSYAFTPIDAINDKLAALRHDQNNIATWSRRTDCTDHPALVARYQANHNEIHRLQFERAELIDDADNWSIDDPCEFWDRADAAYDRYRDTAVGL